MTHTLIRNNPWQWLLLITLLGMFTLPTQATVPDNVDYQGYLTDSIGSPINGTVFISFSLYNLETGGIALWSDIRLVPVTNGLFNVKLGGSGSPFPLGLFDDPLWLGIEVAVDGEMTPRIELSSAGFAHKADDANTVGGISPGSLVQTGDLSAHAGDASAHHSKTTSFTELSDQASDAQIPATITRDSELSTHTGDASAHHLRYTNGEAIGAMGTKVDTNPLHHDKRSDVQVFTAVTDQDGAGSTLDADLVDGLEASEIIDAASDEVRTPISSLPFTISTPGSYYVTDNLDGSAGGINITADNVTLDLMGFTLNGGGTIEDFGISIYSDNVTIKNGTVRGFGLSGIHGGSSYVVVLDIKALGNGTLGDSLFHSGIYLDGSNNHIERCTAGGNSWHGIYAGAGSKLINNTAYGNVGESGYGISGGNGAVLSGNTAYNNTGENAIYGGKGAILSGNTAYGNTAYIAIYGNSGATLNGNTLYNNSGSIGLTSGGGSTLSNNTVYNHSGQYAIEVGGGSTLSNNTVYNNTGWGIYTYGASIIRDNTIYNNNTGGGGGSGGLRVGSESRVMGNTVSGNLVNNIHVTGTDNALIENHVTNSTNGINFLSAGNYYRNNTASGNTTDFAGSLPTGAGDGGGNASF